MVQGRVAILVQDIDAIGGAEAQALLLARELRRRGREVTVLTTRGPGPTCAGADLDVVRLPLTGFEPLAALALRARPDVVALYAVQVTLGVVAARLGDLLGLSVAVKLACSGPPGDMATLGRMSARARRRAVEALRRTQVVCMTRDIEAEAHAVGLMTTVRIPNGVDADALTRAPIVRPLGETPTVLFVGRLAPEKGVDLLIDAVGALRATHPDVRLLVAGDGPDRRALEARAQAVAAGAVVFLGRRDDVRGLLRGATVVAIPSRSDGMANVLLEALAAGAAVVATDIPAAREVAGDDALLVPPEDSRALARGLATALDDPALRARLGAAGPQRVRGTFGIERVADAYQALFDRLAAPQPPGRLGFAARFACARAAQARRLLEQCLLEQC